MLGNALMVWHKRIHFRQVHFANLDKVRPNTPVIIAANHPTAFLDPVAIGCFTDAPMFFMTRGDIFRKKKVRQVLEQFNMFPVNRVRDGFTEEGRLDEMNEIIVRLLGDRTAVCVFVEGQHHADKRVLSAQKGVARIAFTAFEKLMQDDLQIVPVGCNYWLSDAPRDVLYLNAGDPIFVRDYKEEYQKAPAAAMLRLCRDIQSRLIDICYHIENQGDDELCEQLLTIHRSDFPPGHFPVTFYGSAGFDAEKNVLNKVNQLPADTKDILTQKASAYFDTLQKLGLKDEALVNNHWLGFGRWVILTLGFPMFLAGWLMRLPVAALASWVTDTKIKKKEFKSSIFLGVDMFFGAFWYGLLVLISLFSLSPSIIGVALFLPLLGWFSIIYLEIAQRITIVLKARRSSQRTALLAERAAIKDLYA